MDIGHWPLALIPGGHAPCAMPLQHRALEVMASRPDIVFLFPAILRCWALGPRFEQTAPRVSCLLSLLSRLLSPLSSLLLPPIIRASALRR